METSRQPYPSDLTQEQWDLIAPFAPEPRPVHDSDLRYERRAIVNAIRYRVRTGCQWRYLPHHLPRWEPVSHDFAEWTRLGILANIQDALRKRVRRASGKKAKATAGSIDSQTAKTSPMAETSGYDGGKKVKGRKRHLFVDTWAWSSVSWSHRPTSMTAWQAAS